MIGFSYKRQGEVHDRLLIQTSRRGSMIGLLTQTSRRGSTIGSLTQTARRASMIGSLTVTNIKKGVHDRLSHTNIMEGVYEALSHKQHHKGLKACSYKNQEGVHDKLSHTNIKEGVYGRFSTARPSRREPMRRHTNILCPPYGPPIYMDPLWTPYGPPMFCACKREEGSIVVCGSMWGSDTRHTREPNDLHDPNNHDQHSPLTCRT